MGIFETCMQRWTILTFLVALSVGISIAANGGAIVQNNTSSNVGTNMASKISILSFNYTGDDQLVEISNNGTSNVDFTGWKLINMMKANTYSFPTGFSLMPAMTVKVHSGQGTDTSTDLYNSKLTWDKADTAILKDASGKIVSSYPAAKDITR
jgi:predicted transcriptional regulator